MKVMTFGARAFFVVFLSAQAFAAQESVTFAFFNDKPWSFMDPTVRDPLCPARGSIVALTKELVHQLGYKLKCAQLPWPRVQKAVQDGTADLMWTVATKERLKYSVPVPEPLSLIKIRAFTSADNPKTAGIKAFYGPSDPQFKGLHITMAVGSLGWLRDNMGEAFAKKVTPFVHTNAAPHALQAKHQDIMIELVETFAQYVKRAHMSPNLFRHIRLGAPHEDVPLVFLLSKKSPLMKEDFVSRLNDLLKKAKKEGKINL